MMRAKSHHRLDVAGVALVLHVGQGHGIVVRSRRRERNFDVRRRRGAGGRCAGDRIKHRLPLHRQPRHDLPLKQPGMGVHSHAPPILTIVLIAVIDVVLGQRAIELQEIEREG